MNDEKELLAVWLLPESPTREWFASLIMQLARRFDAPIFDPHLTLCVGRLNAAEQRKALSKFEVRESLELEVFRMESSASFTKTLYLRFKASPPLLALRDGIAEAIGADKAHYFDPHLSLLYKNLPNEKRGELAEELEIPFERVRFSKMKAIATSSKIETRREVESWQTIWEQT